MGLLDGFEKLGLKNIEVDGMYKEEPQPTRTVEAPKIKEIPDFDEADMLFKKTYECPVCDTKYQCLTVKSNRARAIRIEKDLRPVYQDGFEPIKYEALVCPVCGYSVMSRYFQPLAPTQRKWIKDSIGVNFNVYIPDSSTITYDEAIERITLVLASSIVKKAKASEKAYVCLKGYWLCKSYAEAMMEDDDFDAAKLKEIKEKQDEFRTNAYEGFISARQSETFPMGGMDESTLDYLLAEMSLELDRIDVASKLVASILQSSVAAPRMKDKARELKEEIVEIIKRKKAE